MENNPILSEKAQAKFDDKRFPKTWQAMLAAALMNVSVYAALYLISNFLQIFHVTFKSEFGVDMFGAVLSQFFALLILPLCFVLFAKKDFKSTFRLKKGIDPLQILLLFVISVGAFYLFQVINVVFVDTAITYFGEPAERSGTTPASNISQLLFEIVIVAGLPAICEEFFFRGLVLRAFERHSKISAILISSATFAIMHGNLQQLLYAFMIGLLLGTLTVLTDSILAGTVIHFTLNMTSVIITYPPINNPIDKFAQANPNLFSLIVLVALPAVAALACALFISYTSKKNKALYGKSVVSDLNHASLMPKSTVYQKIALVFSAVAFVLFNVASMYSLWVGK